MSLAAIGGCDGAEFWSVDSTQEWSQGQGEGIGYEDGLASLTKGKKGTYRSQMRQFETKRSAKELMITQSPVWANWEETGNLGPENLLDAPVMLTKGPDDYWMFGRYGDSKKKNVEAEVARLEGFEIPLKTTPFRNQFDAPGAAQKGMGGYHAWQSRDMVNWVHHGPVTESFSRWVTTAEQVDGKTYIYYDYPNDQDPHLYIDEDLTDGKPGENMGLAFADPSDGSDCAVIRDLERRFHVIYEDWSPINAQNHSWDSPLAGHAVSADGKGDFKILDPAVDDRTEPTGEFAEYLHPHWKKEHPDWDSNVARYEIHQPEQNAYGDWAAISIGGQYYLFADYHPANDQIRLGWFTSASLDEPFKFCGELGKGHPDPDIAFADGRFYLATQMKNDYVSTGPWVEKVMARVGVDTDRDGNADAWSDWSELKESYDHIEGFSKQIARSPAAMKLDELPDGYGFCFELSIEDMTENDSQPLLDAVKLSFD